MGKRGRFIDPERNGNCVVRDQLRALAATGKKDLDSQHEEADKQNFNQRAASQEPTTLWLHSQVGDHPHADFGVASEKSRQLQQARHPRRRPQSDARPSCANPRLLMNYEAVHGGHSS